MEGRVLSIQSHVVHGYVGNKSAVFPLQLLGFDVDFVNSVQFSNHTGYSGGFKGQVLNGEQLEVLMAGLAANSLVNGTSHLLTGYIGSVTFLRAVTAAHAQLKACNPDLVYVCDPVLGDNGKLYVPPELVEVYRNELISLATILTPNQVCVLRESFWSTNTHKPMFFIKAMISPRALLRFSSLAHFYPHVFVSKFEAEQLTGMAATGGICSLTDAVSACLLLHEKGPSTVIITSLEVQEEEEAGAVASDRGGGGGGGGQGSGAKPTKQNIIRMLATTVKPRKKRKKKKVIGGGGGPSDGPSLGDEKRDDDDGGGGDDDGHSIEAWVLDIPKLEGSYTGTGDLTAALFLAHLSSLSCPCSQNGEGGGEEAGGGGCGGGGGSCGDNGAGSTHATAGSTGSTLGALPSPQTSASTSASLPPPAPPPGLRSGPHPHTSAPLSSAMNLLPRAMSAVAASLTAVIHRTLTTAGPGAELRLVQSKRDLESPDCTGFVPTRVPPGVLASAHVKAASIRKLA